jgi:hypothetical protein
MKKKNPQIHIRDTLWGSIEFSEIQSNLSFKKQNKKKNNRYFHMLIWKTGGSSPSDRNVMSFHEWSAAERVERHKKNLSRVEDPAMFHINT